MNTIEETIKNITDQALKRGEMTFLAKIHAAIPNMTSTALHRATLLCAAFHGNIKSMPLDGSYAAVRLASSVVIVASDDKVSEDDLVSATLENYNLADPAALSRTVVPKHFAHENSEVEGNFGHHEAVKPDAPMLSLQGLTTNYRREFEFDADVIDLLEDADVAELSIEGKRKLGLVDVNFNSLTDVDDSELIDTRVYGVASLGADGQVESITCPHCGKLDVYTIGLSEYGCFGCDAEFPVKIGMSDLHGE